MAAPATVRWPRVLSAAHLAHLIRRQKNPYSALRLLASAPLRYPTYAGHTSALYAAAISAAAPHLHRLLPDFLSLLKQMSLSASPARDHLFAAAISTLPPTPALHAFSLIPPSNCVSWPLSLHAVLRCLLAHGDLQATHQVLDQSSQRPGAKFGVRTLNLVIAALCRLGRVDLAVDVFMEIREQCLYPDQETYRILMKGLCEARRLDDAKHLLYSMLRRISQKGCLDDVVVYRTLLEALVRDGRVVDAEEILGKVLKKGLRSPGKRRAFQIPDLREKSSQETRELINEALVVGGVRSAASYRAVIVDLYEEGEFEQANKLLYEMVGRGFKPDVVLYETKAVALCGEGRAEDAVHVLDEMVESGCLPRVGTYNIVMKGLCNQGNSSRAIELLDKMDRQIGCVACKETFDILVCGLCSEGMFLKAACMLERMVRRRYWPESSIFSSVIHGLCSIGRSYEAFLWLEEMTSCGHTPEFELWTSLVTLVCHDTSRFLFLSSIHSNCSIYRVSQDN